MKTKEIEKVYTFEQGLDVQVEVINEEPWFVAADVCQILGLTNPTQSVMRLDPEDRLSYTLHRAGQSRQVKLVNESGLYVLILRSNKPEARAFRRWVTSEVLPQLRKNGSYGNHEYGRRIELLESGVGTLIGAMTNLTTMIAATLQPAAPQLQTIAKPTPHPQGSRAMLVNLVERAVAIAGSQVNLTNWMGVSESVISDIKSTRLNRPGRVMTNYFIDCCNKVVQLGRIPDELPVKPKGMHRRNRTNKANLIADICKIKDDGLRLSLLNKVTGGRAL